MKFEVTKNHQTMACSSINLTTTTTTPYISTMRKSYSDNNLNLLHSSTCVRASSTRLSKLKPSRSFGILPDPKRLSSILPNPIRSLLFDTKEGNPVKTFDVDTNLDHKEVGPEVGDEHKGKRENWVERLLELRMKWKERREEMNEYDEKEDDIGDDDGEDGCFVNYGETAREGERESFDAESFSRLLVQVPWSDANRFSKLAFLCNKAYVIPEIKANDSQLQQYYGLHFVTSSLEKKTEATALKAKLNKNRKQGNDPVNLESDTERVNSENGHMICSSVAAYEIAASAASHVHCCASNECADESLRRGCKSERAAQMAASTITAVVAAREKEKQEVAKELQSLNSSPCEWFICDDPCTHMRYFVIQGSESMSAWQTNLFFEPVKFEDTDALVHRGIYEAAKGIYKQFLPEIQSHINTYGAEAKLQFTGHSLGGSLSQLVHMILIARQVVKPSTLLPVVSFGSPFVFCGGNKILEQWGIDENHIHCVVMHRDIVPRAFSCSYPRQVAQVLKRLSGSFRAHPCLNKNKMLYSPLGRIYILQPAEILSPSHPWLPPGCALYALDSTQTATVALRAFLNTPHPLESLSDPAAYGSEGNILRDHHSSNYAKTINSVMRQYTKMALREVRKERHLIWPLIASPSQHAWTHGANLENRSLRKEIMTSV